MANEVKAAQTAIGVLNGLKELIETKVAKKIKLPKEKSNPVELVNPYVSLITLPHKNFMPVNFQVPHILIGLANGVEDMQENRLTIRIQCAVYGGDIQFKEDANIPDETGYIELINLIEKLKSTLTQAAVTDGGGAIEKSFNYGIYDSEFTYPYWYGYVEFPVQIPYNERQLLEF